MPARLRWSESEPVEALASAHELRVRLTQLNDSRERPLLVEVDDVCGFHLKLALDGDESILIVHRLRQPADGPSDEWTSCASAPRPGSTEYFLFGTHHTELPDEYRIATGTALDAVVSIFDHARLPSTITWDQNTF